MPPIQQDKTENTFIAKGMVLTIGLFVIAVPILLGIIMIRSFWASNAEELPNQAPAAQIEQETR